MREIEFRGKLKRTGKWAYGNLNINKAGTVIITPDETPLGTYGEVDPETIGEYTGLKDKNGVKIYEGEIVIDREDGVIGDIVWNKEEASFYFSILYENGTYEEEKLNDWVDVLEVIGNIYDNPELLEGGK